MNNNLIEKKEEEKKEEKREDPLPIEDFEIEKYMGKWYEKARTPNPFQKTESKNTTAEYTLLQDGSVQIKNSSIFQKKKREIIGSGNFYNKKNVGDLSITFGQNFFTKWLMKGRYKIVKTDYENFSFLYIKTTYFFFFTKIFAWILTRDPNPREEVMEGYLENFLGLTGLEKKDLVFCENDLVAEDLGGN